jgi:hypothetical protein
LNKGRPIRHPLVVDFGLVASGAEDEVGRYTNKAVATACFAALDRFHDEIATFCLKQF